MIVQGSYSRHLVAVCRWCVVCQTDFFAPLKASHHHTSTPDKAACRGRSPVSRARIDTSLSTMAANGISPTLEYLTDAAHLMRVAAPETAAHLMSQRSHLMFHHDMALSDVQRQHACGACGHIMIPGNESMLKLESRRSKRGATQPPNQRPNPQTAKAFTKVIRCGRCDRLTKISVAPPALASRQRVGKTKAKTTGMAGGPISAKDVGVAAAPNASANASSKKRAKNRKAGLQALLAGQQQQKANPLSLADFMKK